MDERTEIKRDTPLNIEHHDPNMPPMGMHSSLESHCGEIKTSNEKKRMRKEVKYLRQALSEHKPTARIKETKDGLGGYGCGVKNTGSKLAQIAYLRSILDAPKAPN